MSTHGYHVILDVTAARRGEGSIIVTRPGWIQGFSAEYASNGLAWELAVDLADDIAEAANAAKDMAPPAEEANDPEAGR